MGFAENDEVWQAYLSTFRQALQNLGWTEGRNIRFDYRFSGESEERMHRMAEEIVGLAPDVILASTNSARSFLNKVRRQSCLSSNHSTNSQRTKISLFYPKTAVQFASIASSRLICGLSFRSTLSNAP